MPITTTPIKADITIIKNVFRDFKVDELRKVIKIKILQAGHSSEEMLRIYDELKLDTATKDRLLEVLVHYMTKRYATNGERKWAEQ